MATGSSLQRSMREIGPLLLTLSAVSPASSVFVIVPGVFQAAGTGAFLSMVVTAFVSLAVAWVYAELSSAFPIAGGEYCMVGRTLGPGAGFVVLALTILGNMLAPTVFALGAATYINVLIPNLDPVDVGLAIIAITTLLGILHVRTNAWITGAFLALEVLALVTLTILGFVHVHRSLAALALHPVVLAHNSFAPATLAMIGISTAVSLFAYNGYGSAVYFAEEMHEAPRTVARAIMWSLVITIVTELLPVTAVLMGAPDLKALLSHDSPFAYFVAAIGGTALNIAISLSVALAVINAVLVTILQNGRFFYSTGRDQSWHPSINDAFMRTHSRFNSPWIATLASGASAALVCFVKLELLLILTGTGLIFIYGALCLGTLIGRRGGATEHGPYKMPFFPLVPVLALGFLAYVICASWLDPDAGRWSLIVNAIVIVASLAYYRLVLARREGWTLFGPEDGLGDPRTAGHRTADPLSSGAMETLRNP